MDEKVKEDFLAQWPQNKRATIMNQFLRVIREDGADKPDRLLRWLHTATSKRLDSPYCQGEDREAQLKLLDACMSDDGWQMAEYCLWWESLSREEKTKIKQRRGTDYAKQAMSAQPPTEKQLKYLATLGCDEIPISQAQASEWIDARVKK